VTETVVALPLGSDVINVAGTASFVVSENAHPVSYRLIWVVIRDDDDWKIVSHRASPKVAPSEYPPRSRMSGPGHSRRPDRAPITSVYPKQTCIKLPGIFQTCRRRHSLSENPEPNLLQFRLLQTA